MKALTVEEYRVLTMPVDEDYTSRESEVNDRLVEAGMMRFAFVSDDDCQCFAPTNDGERAVRVHRAFLASMGGQAPPRSGC